MPIFMIERGFAEAFLPTLEGAEEVNLINEDEGVRWLYSFLSADKHKTYCLYEAESADALRRAAVRAGLPADTVIELGNRVSNQGVLEAVDA